MSTAEDESSNFLNNTVDSNEVEGTELKFDPLLVKTEEDPGCGDVDKSFDYFQIGNDYLQIKTENEDNAERSIGPSRKKTSGCKKRKRRMAYNTRKKRMLLCTRKRRAAEAAVKCRQELEALEALLDEPGKVDPVLWKLWEIVENPDGSLRRKRVDEMTPQEQICLWNLVRQLKEASLEEKGKRTQQKARARVEKELQVLEAFLDSEDPGESGQVDREVLKAWEIVEAPDGSKRRKRVDEMRTEEQICLWKLVRKRKRLGKAKAVGNGRKKVVTEEEMRERRMKAYKKHVAKTASMTPEEKEQCRLKIRERQRKIREKLVAEVGVEGVRAMARNKYRSMTPEKKKAFLEIQRRYYKRKLEELKKDPERLRFFKIARNIRKQKKDLEEREKKGITPRRNVLTRYYWRKDVPDLPPDEIERMAAARKKEVGQRTQLRRRLKSQGLPQDEIQRQVNELIKMQNLLPPGAPGKPSLDFGERKRKTAPGSGPSVTPRKGLRKSGVRLTALKIKSERKIKVIAEEDELGTIQSSQSSDY